ncbi:MAG TPA: SpoIIE family protein phosphatase [Bacteroidia bacterium]|jgi:serine phosphatase RsbU (regulator of sigma subunit)
MNILKEVLILPPRRKLKKNKTGIHLLNEPQLKNKELNESIIYAKRIQEGMMLKEKHLSRLFDSSFLLFKPKDIVSGDFYWFTKIGSKVIIAAADCTGHGIPGAFMSVLGISLLNQIVIEEKNTDVSFILQRLDHKIKKAFGYSNDYFDDAKSLYDGMDIAICCIDYDQQQFSFAGAFRPMYHISENGLVKIEGSRYPIGGMHLEENREYEKKVSSFKTGDKLYFFTDGFADQFGGPGNRKFMTANFRNIIARTARFSMQTQKMELERFSCEWKNNYEQTDDILVVGVQL